MISFSINILYPGIKGCNTPTDGSFLYKNVHSIIADGRMDIRLFLLN